jgi:hypothetical protein
MNRIICRLNYSTMSMSSCSLQFHSRLPVHKLSLIRVVFPRILMLAPLGTIESLGMRYPQNSFNVLDSVKVLSELCRN